MMITGQQRDTEIAKLNLTSSLAKLTCGEFVHDDLEYRCEAIKYSLEPEDFSPKNLDIIPLWESESSITGFYYENNDPIFVQYYIDDIDNYKTIGKSISELINYLVIEYAENEDELRKTLNS